ALLEVLPHEDLVYLGDTGRYPYGTKSAETVTRYSIENVDFLIAKGIKLLVVACNTASSVALEALAARYPVPVVGVIEPGARAAAARTRNGRVGVIGTEATIASGAYTTALPALKPGAQSCTLPCPPPHRPGGRHRHRGDHRLGRLHDGAARPEARPRDLHALLPAPGRACRGGLGRGPDPAERGRDLPRHPPEERHRHARPRLHALPAAEGGDRRGDGRAGGARRLRRGDGARSGRPARGARPRPPARGGLDEHLRDRRGGQLQPHRAALPGGAARVGGAARAVRHGPAVERPCAPAGNTDILLPWAPSPPGSPSQCAG